MKYIATPAGSDPTRVSFRLTIHRDLIVPYATTDLPDEYTITNDVGGIWQDSLETLADHDCYCEDENGTICSGGNLCRLTGLWRVIDRRYDKEHIFILTALAAECFDTGEQQTLEMELPEWLA